MAPASISITPAGGSASAQIRNLATLGGNLLFRLPTWDNPPWTPSGLAPQVYSGPVAFADFLETVRGGEAHVEVTFRGDMTVELIKHSASDADVIWAARVSTRGEQSLAEISAEPERSAGLINFLMRDRHGTPFEHSTMTFYVQAPIFVFREFMRHRTFSYNEESGRYRTLAPVFYVPGPDRDLVQAGKPGAYQLSAGTPEQHELAGEVTRAAYRGAYEAYQRMLAAGIARLFHEHNGANMRLREAGTGLDDLVGGGEGREPGRAAEHDHRQSREARRAETGRLVHRAPAAEQVDRRRMEPVGGLEVCRGRERSRQLTASAVRHRI